MRNEMKQGHELIKIPCLNPQGQGMTDLAAHLYTWFPLLRVYTPPRVYTWGVQHSSYVRKNVTLFWSKLLGKL